LSDILYKFEPPLQGDHVLELAELARARGSTMHQLTSAWMIAEAQNLIRDLGPAAILRRQLLTEAVLPDQTPRDQLLDTIRYQLSQCRPTTSLLIIDPYLFPSNADSTYLDDLVCLVTPAVEAGIDPEIATQADRDPALESAFLTRLATIGAGGTAKIKHTKAFHDRFWIADGERGLFMGTSLNGIGRRYAIADYLEEDDARKISARFAVIP
jgi:hypothetical protein